MIAGAVWFGCCVVGLSISMAADKIVDAITELKGDE